MWDGVLNLLVSWWWLIFKKFVDCRSICLLVLHSYAVASATARLDSQAQRGEVSVHPSEGLVFLRSGWLKVRYNLFFYLPMHIHWRFVARGLLPGWTMLTSTIEDRSLIVFRRPTIPSSCSNGILPGSKNLSKPHWSPWNLSKNYRWTSIQSASLSTIILHYSIPQPYVP